jgi:hypothetical protein
VSVAARVCGNRFGARERNSKSSHSSIRLPQKHKPGLHLFLAWWYFQSLKTHYKVKYFDTTVLPKAYNIWVLAAAILSAQQLHDSAWTELVSKHLVQIETEEDFFVTKSGYFGRCSKAVAKTGNQVPFWAGHIGLTCLRSSHRVIIISSLMLTWKGSYKALQVGPYSQNTRLMIPVNEWRERCSNH